MNDLLNDEVFRGQIAFIGQTLGPFFLEDPKMGNASEAFEAIAGLEVDEAAEEWPFVKPEQARSMLSKMKDSLSGDFDIEELTWEYRRLFVGPAMKAMPPWGSVYTDRECVVFGRSTLDLRQWMRENGIERLQDEKTPEDHIGLMLLLMAWMAEVKPECLEDYLRLHMFTWTSHFLTQLSEVSEHAFYRGLAEITKASLEGVQEKLALEVEYPRYYR